MYYDKDMHIDPRLNDIDDCLYRAAARAIVVYDGKVLLIKEVFDDWWAFPGGGIDHGETIKSSLLREIEEEIGVPAAQISSDFRIVHYDIGNIVNTVPRINLYFKLLIEPQHIHKTNDVGTWQWCTKGDFMNIDIHPSYNKHALLSIIFAN